jgi:hypothetical protein
VKPEYANKQIFRRRNMCWFIIMIAISKLKRVGIGKLPNQVIITLKIRNMDVLITTEVAFKVGKGSIFPPWES